MKDNGNENISICFVIEPIQQKNKRKDTNDEVQTIRQFGIKSALKVDNLAIIL